MIGPLLLVGGGLAIGWYFLKKPGHAGGPIFSVLLQSPAPIPNTEVCMHELAEALFGKADAGLILDAGLQQQQGGYTVFTAGFREMPHLPQVGRTFNLYCAGVPVTVRSVERAPAGIEIPKKVA
jgi:hypothetical protein